MAHAQEQLLGPDAQTHSYDHWEFFCSPTSTEGNPRGWAWRGRLGAEVVFESPRFPSFMACYRDARARGFVGDIDFVPGTTEPDSPYDR